MRKLKFNLTIDTTALLCPNATEFYSKAYIDDSIVDNYRTIPGVKYSTEIATTSFSNILKAASCNFSATDQALSATPISVCAVSALAELCRVNLETSFLSMSMAKGSNASFEVQPFMDYYWSELTKEIKSEVDQIRWKGSTTEPTYTGSSAYLALCDGYEKQLAADAAVLDVTLTAITVSNVIAAMSAVVNKMAVSAPQVNLYDPNLRLYVSPNVAAAYRQAVAQANTVSYVTQDLDLTFLGIKIVVSQLTTSKMVLTLKDNLVYAFDGLDDSKQIKAVNLEDTISEPKLRTRVDLKIGFKVLNGQEVVYYN